MFDTWDETFLKPRAAQDAKAYSKKGPTLIEIDYLLGVFDESSMGALRFKTDLKGLF